MKKFTGLIITLTLLSGCAESLALLGSMSGSGNITQSALSSSISYGVKSKQANHPQSMLLHIYKNIILKIKKINV